MLLTVLLFASYRDLAGTDMLAVELPSGSSAGDLIARLREGGGRWAALPAQPAVAVNREYVPLGTALVEGDEIALIPPVAGG